MQQPEEKTRALKKQIIAAYSEDTAQEKYLAKAENGLWDSESYFIRNYWKSKGTVIDIGCGTGRTTLALHRQGYAVTGVDLVPAMIQLAKQVAEKNKEIIPYVVGDATLLDFSSESFDYALFSNLGWPQIPTTEERLKALQEVHRVLKQNGIFILVTPHRIWLSSFFLFWVRQWIKHYILKPLGFSFREASFGDRFYDRETKDKKPVFKTLQYIFIPSIKEVTEQLEHAGFRILETNDRLQISQKDIRKVRPMFYIAQKI